MATITFLSASEASKYTTVKPTAIQKPEVDCKSLKENYDDMCEFSFIEATPVIVSDIPEDIGLTLKDIFIDSSSTDDDVEIIEEKINRIADLSVTNAKQDQKSNIENDVISRDIESYISMTKNNPDVKISRGTFEQMINTEPPKGFQMKSNKIVKMLEDMHRNSNMQPSVIIQKLVVQPSLAKLCHKFVNQCELKTEPPELSFTEDIVDDYNLPRTPEISFDTSDEDTFEGFPNIGYVTRKTSRDLRNILKQFLQEQKDVISVVTDFSLSSQLSNIEERDEVTILNVVKICLLCRQTNHSNNIQCWNCKEKIGVSSLKYIKPCTKNKKYQCSYCDYVVEDMKILAQHYIIHGKSPLKVIKFSKQPKCTLAVPNKRKMDRGTSKSYRRNTNVGILDNLRRRNSDEALNLNKKVFDNYVQTPIISNDGDNLHAALEQSTPNMHGNSVVKSKTQKSYVYKSFFKRNKMSAKSKRARRSTGLCKNVVACPPITNKKKPKIYNNLTSPTANPSRSVRRNITKD